MNRIRRRVNEVADQIITYKELVAMYKKDNDVLRNANESLMSLIAKYQNKEEQKYD